MRRFAPRRRHVEADAGGAADEVGAGDAQQPPRVVRAGAKTVADQLEPAPLDLAGELGAEVVVEIEHRMRQRFAGEELRFRAAVTRHRAVIVEVIAREVGQQRDVELDAGQAPLVEADRRDFHADRGGAAPREFRELRLQPQRVRRGVDQRPQFAAQAVAECADHRGADAAIVQRARDPLAAGGLAVGARHADHAQTAARVIVEAAGDQAGARAQVGDRAVRHMPARLPPESAFLPQHRRGARRDRLRDEAAAVARFARIGDEGVAALHRAAVAGQPAHAKLIERAQFSGRQRPAECRVRDCGSRRHTSSRTSGALGGGSTTLLTGASGLMPSRRSVPAITLLNTGAATVPP